jgi:hypothetical protein
MTDERLLARLRGRGIKDTIAAADRIEALTAERDEANKRGDAWRFRADIAEAKLEKVLNHIRKMQGYVQEYLEPGPYVVKHGNGRTFSEPHPNQDEAYAYFMRQQMREAVLNDLIHMLDGPEERALLAEIEGEQT